MAAATKVVTRLAAASALSIAAAVVGAPAVGSTGVAAVRPVAFPAQNDPAARDALEARSAELTKAIDEVDARLPALAAAAETATATVAGLERELADNAQRAEQLAAERVGPARARQELVVSLYVRGDPDNEIAAEFLRTGELQTDNLRGDVLFRAAEEFARARLAELDASAGRLRTTRADLETRRVAAETTRATAQAVVEDTRARRAQVAADLATVKDQLKALLAASQLAPLTGALDYPLRPVVGVKIDNTPPSRPQVGISNADVVYEEIVEGGITRFLAMFQSREVDRIGPVRSARTTDTGLLGGYNTPLFAFSGGNDGVLAAVRSANLVSLTESSAPRAFVRDEGRSAPYNLFTSTTGLYSAAAGRGGMSPSQFAFRKSGEAPVGGRPVQGVSVQVGSDQVAYRWNGAGWARETNGRVHEDAITGQIAPENVIVQFTNYAISPADADSPDAVTVGSGEAWILTAGQLIVARWARATAIAPILYTDATGVSIPITPGRTWIALPRPGSGTVLG